MAVYTKITTSQLQQHLKNYQLGELLKVNEIIDGIDNSNFIIHTTQNKFILTIFEKRINPQDLPFFINLKEHLAQKNISCPKPIANKNNEFITKFINKDSVIVSFLNGKTLQANQQGYYLNITNKHCQQVGQVLAKMHLAVSDFKGYRNNDLGINNFQNLFNKFAKNLPEYQKGLDQEIANGIELLSSLWQKNHNQKMPSHAVHLDLFADNVFFDDQQNLTGVIDFYFAGNDLLILDLAITVNAWCFDQTKFNNEKFLNMLDSYQKIREINSYEKKFLNIALATASLRFLLTRLHDMFFTNKNSLVKIKDPQEYLEKFRYFKQQI